MFGEAVYFEALAYSFLYDLLESSFSMFAELTRMRMMAVRHFGDLREMLSPNWRRELWKSGMSQTRLYGR